MEIKCKVSFSIPEELMKALDITDDTPVVASIKDGAFDGCDNAKFTVPSQCMKGDPPPTYRHPQRR